MPESSSLRAVLAQVVEYGPQGVVEDADAAQLYGEAADMDSDSLDCDDDMPLFPGDERMSRPSIRRFTTVPLTIDGTVTQ